MFSGIVEEYGTVVAIEKDKENVHFTLTCSFANELKIDQSVSHNGVCLTVVWVDKTEKKYKVTAIKETLLKSNLGLLEVGSKVNLERSMMMNGRLDGHIVQGHIDGRAKILRFENNRLTLTPQKELKRYIAYKGSITINGVSLTVSRLEEDSFSVDLITHTQEKTNLGEQKEGDEVNIEIDLIARYLERLVEVKEQEADLEFLRERNLI